MSIRAICQKAKENVYSIANTTESDKNKMLQICADSIRQNESYILAENKKDIDSCNRPAHFIDRLLLNTERMEDIAKGLEKLIALKSPVGEVIEEFTVENGLHIQKVRVPLGVLGMIYEARPNVTIDAIALAIKSGNAVVLRGSKDALYSNIAIVNTIKSALEKNGYFAEFIQLIEDGSREGAVSFMQMNGLIDVIIPRGGASLIQSVVQNATVPIIETGTGNCHVYFENSASFEKSLPVLINAKTQRITPCNTCESLLVDDAFAQKYLTTIVKALIEKEVTIYACERALSILKADSNAKSFLNQKADFIQKATEEDFYAEYLDKKISLKIVQDTQEAIRHINKYSTHHSDCILTEDIEKANLFLAQVDSAVVYHNASTRFTDGFEFGFGAEIGISTQKLHARGPMALKELTSYKYCVRGNGQIRK